MQTTYQGSSILCSSILRVLISLPYLLRYPYPVEAQQAIRLIKDDNMLAIDPTTAPNSLCFAFEVHAIKQTSFITNRHPKFTHPMIAMNLFEQQWSSANLPHRQTTGHLAMLRQRAPTRRLAASWARQVGANSKSSDPFGQLLRPNQANRL